MDRLEISLPPAEVREQPYFNTEEPQTPQLIEEAPRWRKTRDALAALTLSTVMLAPQMAEAVSYSDESGVVVEDISLATTSLSERSAYCRTRDRIILIAHRGVSEPGGDGTRRIGGRLYTENTASAIVKGIKMGADGSEFDHWRARDGESVVYHDTRLGRPDPDPNKRGRVDGHAYENDLERVRLPSGAKLPTYAQVVRAVDGNTRSGSLQVELKQTRGTHAQKTEWITNMVTRALEYREDNPSANVLFTSGSRTLLGIVNKVSKGTIDTGLINFGARVIPLRNVARWIDGINNAPTTRGLTPRYVRNAHRRNIETGVRSVNTKALFVRLVNRLHVDRVITDKANTINNGC